jgi:hypothetical protein
MQIQKILLRGGRHGAGVATLPTAVVGGSESIDADAIGV